MIRSDSSIVLLFASSFSHWNTDRNTFESTRPLSGGILQPDWSSGSSGPSSVPYIPRLGANRFKCHRMKSSAWPGKSLLSVVRFFSPCSTWRWMCTRRRRSVVVSYICQSGHSQGSPVAKISPIVPCINKILIVCGSRQAISARGRESSEPLKVADRTWGEAMGNCTRRLCKGDEARWLFMAGAELMPQQTS